MPTANVIGWASLAILFIGLGGCASHPSRASLFGAGQAMLAKSPLCVLTPRALANNFGEHMFVEAKDRAVIDPFIAAGLLQFVDKPIGMADEPLRLWYEVTPYGRQWSSECLTRPYSYPVGYSWGFRIGRPEFVKTYPMSLLTRHECFTSASVMVEYRMKLEPWFVPGRFETNFAAGGAVHYYDAARNVGRTHIPFMKGRARWVQGEIRLGPHSNFSCEKFK